MGRSKFPGKPSKIGNRKRVNLSSFSLPEDNDSSKAAEKIYLGLSHFNETFGDNEMVAPGPFHGFSSSELEEAIAEARIQQKEAETEMKKHGKNINLWQDFQKELSLINCGSITTKNSEMNKRKLFDGGGSSKNPTDNSDNRPSSTYNIRSNLESPKRLNRDAFAVAKKLVERAKSNIIENSKSNVEKKFILPRRSIHSSRVIIPNKKFLEENANKNGKFLRSRSVNEVINNKKPKVLENKTSLSEELKIDVSDEKKKSKSGDSSPVKIQDDKNNKKSQESPKNTTSSGKIILREARLQLDNNLSLMEGPFSSPNASSLSPNSQLKVNLQSSPGTLVCGVCGSVRLNMRQKYGILCCESCQKLISKIKKMCNAQEPVQLECNSGGLCQYWTVKSPDSIKCEACWLKMCLKNSKLPWKLRCKLSKMLPVTMQVGTGFDSPILIKDISNKFVVGDNNMKDFKWFHEASTSSSSTSAKTITSENQTELKDKTPESLNKKARSLRRKNLQSKKQSKFLKHSRKKKIIQIDKKRQIIDLKGPRVKHVCRSASIVLGQPLATFPSEPSPSKKQSNNSECKSCDELITTNDNTSIESQGIVVDKINNKDILVINETKSGNNEKKSNVNVKNMSNVKNIQQKAKKKISSISDNLISMDFWESYDPEEVCETGFGLIGSEDFTIRALCFLCGSSGQEKLIHCASCCEPYHEFCINDGQTKLQDNVWRFDWVCPRCTICSTCGKTSGQQLKCIKCDNSYHTECVNRVRGRLLHSPDRPWVCSACLCCKSCNRDDVSFFVGNLPLCKNCFKLRQLGNYCPLCQRCYEADDYSCKMMECGDCKRWVHAKCEGLSDERYQVLSNLPETVEYICRMCCNIPPAPWWKAVESALKIGYLGVLKALSKNRKACTMLKWSPRKQCRCQNENSEDEESKVKAAGISERKTSIEVIHHPTESLKLTLKIMKNDDEGKVRKSPSCNSLSDSFDCQEDSQASELNYKPTMSSPLNPPSDSGIGSTDDELKAKDDDEMAKGKLIPFLNEKQECFCFLEVDSYNSRSKPFSPNLLSIKKKVTTCEYSSLQQFHEDMESMIETTQSSELIEVYHQTIRDIFPWFDPDTGKVVNTPQKISKISSRESTPNATPVKKSWMEECLIPKEKLCEQPIDYYYNNYTVEDTRICMLCKDVGDATPSEAGRLLYCGQNEWVHCNCALWSGEVFEEIDGSLQNVHSAINRGRSIRCPECNLKGASVGCCARNCAETYHFKCARKIGCVFMDDKTLYCPNHSNESSGKLVLNEKEFEIRRPVYVELDKRKMKSVDSNRVKFAVGGLHIESLGRYIVKLSDQKESIIPAGFQCSRWFWSCYEPWRIVRYHFTIRLLEAEEKEGIDLGVNLTIDHSKEQELVDLKLKQLKYFQQYNKFLEVNEKSIEEKLAEKRKRTESPKLDVKRPKKDHKVVRKIFDQIDSKDDENNLSDNQNTADLLPPDLEEAILKDLPNDILDGISMQDIFMDINKEDANEIEEDIQCDKKEFWGNLSEAVDEFLLKSSKRSKSEVLPKKNTLKNHQRSCSLNWNCKMDQNNSNKWKRSSKLNVTVNLLDSQDRNQLQELKFTDVSLDIKARLNDTRLVQQEEGKENKCLPWHTRLQPRLLQVDGGVDSSSSGSEAGESPQRLIEERNLQSQGYFVNNAATTSYLPLPPDNYFSDSPLPQMDGVDDSNSCEYDSFKISQLDGTVDSDCEGSESLKCDDDDFSLPLTNSTDEKPVTCKECHCTYRTKISYQRHLENCRNNLFLSSSSDEMSEEEKPNEVNIPKVKTPIKTPIKTPVKSPVKSSPVIPKIESIKESPKEKPKPRVYTKRKPVQKPPQIVNKNPQIPQLLLQQQQQPPPAIIVQDCPPVVPTTYLDPNIQYVTTVEPPRPQLIAPQPLPVAFQLQSAPEPQYILPQNGIIIQQPQTAGTIIPQGPIVMANDPVVLGSTPMYEFIQDPQTGGMFLTSHNQPVFYNMETIVHNTVMQTNQFISNVMATSSFSQSTQVFQTSKVEQVMNVPSNVIFVNQNSSITDKIITSNDIICLQPSVIPNQQTVQVQNPVIHTSQTYAEQKIAPSQINPLRCIRPSRKIINVPVNNKPQPVTPQRPIVKSSPMMRPSVSKIQPKTYEKAVITPKSSGKQQTTPSRAIVDFINNFKSDDFQLPIIKNEETPKKPIEVMGNDVAVTKAIEAPLAVKLEISITPPAAKTTTALPTAKMCITPVKSAPLKSETVLKSPPVISVDKFIDKPKINDEKLVEKPRISYDMPSLDDYDDSPSLSIVIPPKVQTPPPLPTPPQLEKKMEILPLQDNSQAINSPNIVKVNNKASPDEKLSAKAELDQNIIATKSITISPRLIENFEKEENVSLENNKTEGSKLIIDAKSDDGFVVSSFTINEVWQAIFNKLQKMRNPLKMPPLPVARKGHEFLGMENHGLQFLLEQLQGAEHSLVYKHRYFPKQSDDKDEAASPIKQNPSGCARTEKFVTRKEFDIFAWLASGHRTMPKPKISEDACRRANSLPIAMQYRHLKETYKDFVRVYKSKIHGRGLFCLREIEQGEMVIEYAGELIRSNVTDIREKYYTDKKIGCCYMFRIDDHFVVDATMKGNAARFINHSCEPNCYSRVVDIRGKKHILIYALRKINVMEELTYDYKFPFEDDKISCHCTSKKCRKYLN